MNFNFTTPHEQASKTPHLTRRQLLQRWGLKAPITLRRWEKAGKLKALRLSRRNVLYPLAEVERIEAQALCGQTPAE